MDNNINFKSHMNIYWFAIALIILSVISIDIFLLKDFKNFSFEFFFLMMIPLWVGVLSINNFETDRVKNALRVYLKEYYPKKLEEFDEKPVELLNSDTEDVLDLFLDEDLIKDPVINNLKIEAKKVTLFMYIVFFIIPALLFSSVFLILK